MSVSAFIQTVLVAAAFLAFGAMAFDMQFVTNYNLFFIGLLFIALAFLINICGMKKKGSAVSQ